jgi:quercetin dioxygenase-like cupin family protein
MAERAKPTYQIEGREIVADGPSYRVSILTLAAGECVPWHYHTTVPDIFFCLEGPMQIETRAPRASHVLMPGETCTVPPKTAHYVSGKDHGRCRFLICQGGDYDFIPVGGEGRHGA